MNKKALMFLLIMGIVFTSCGKVAIKDSSLTSTDSNVTGEVLTSADADSIEASAILEEYTRKIKPAYLSVLYRQAWTAPSNIEPDSLCAFYGYTILYLEKNPSGWDGAIELTTTDVLDALSKHFDGVTENQIKQSDSYDAAKDICSFTAGFGGAVAPHVTDVQKINGNTVIYYDSMAGDEKNGDGIVTINEADGVFKYVSNEYTEKIK